MLLRPYLASSNANVSPTGPAPAMSTGTFCSVGLSLKPRVWQRISQHAIAVEGALDTCRYRCRFRAASGILFSTTKLITAALIMKVKETVCVPLAERDAFESHGIVCHGPTVTRRLSSFLNTVGLQVVVSLPQQKDRNPRSVRARDRRHAYHGQRDRIV